MAVSGCQVSVAVKKSPNPTSNQNHHEKTSVRLDADQFSTASWKEGGCWQ
jgi:hypothetical protein